MPSIVGVMRVFFLAGALALAGGGMYAALTGDWQLAVITLVGLLLLVSALLLHLHRKVGRAATSSADADMRLRRGVEALPAQVTAAVAEEGAAIVDRILEHLEGQLAARLDGLDSVLRDSSTKALEDLEWLRTRTRERFDRIDDRIYRLRHEQVTELDALHQVRERVALTGRRPTVWGWALSPRSLLQLVDRVEQHRPRVVVECGSGLSSIYLGTMLRDVPGARVVSLEHDSQYAQETLRMVRAHDLDHLVEVRFAPLRQVQVGGESRLWYDAEALAGVTEVDLLLVDGPPKATVGEARYPALPLLAERLSSGAVIILDDTHRSEEAAIAKRWLEEFDHLSVSTSTTPDQTVLIWKDGGSGPVHRTSA